MLNALRNYGKMESQEVTMENVNEQMDPGFLGYMYVIDGNNPDTFMDYTHRTDETWLENFRNGMEKARKVLEEENSNVGC